MYGGQQAFFTYLALSSCTSNVYTYQCSTNLQAGTYGIYLNLYDQNINLLSTNVYSNPSPTTIYANGSQYQNNVYVTTAGVLSSLQLASPQTCFAAGVQQSIPLYVLDFDGNTIVGPIANPLTASFTAYNGAGLGAVSLYVMYNGSPAAANTWTMTDSSVYASPYLFVTGQEGATFIAASVANIPLYFNSQAPTYSGNAGYAATGTYIAWGLDNNPQADGMYPIAIQQSLNQAVTCESANGTDDAFIEVESFLDPVTGMPYLVTGDAYNNIAIFDAYSTADASHAYTFFQTSNAYGNIGPKSQLYQSYAFTPSSPFVNVLTSAVWQGRVNLVSSSTIDFDDTSNGAIYSDGAYGPSTVLLNSSTRFAGNPGKSVLYFNDVGTPFLYVFSTGSPPGAQGTPIDFSSGYPITGQIYSISTSGNNSGLELVRGADSTNAFFVCAFSSSAFTGSVTCHATSSTNANPVSMQYDPGSGDVMWASGGTSAFGLPAHNVTPATFIANFPAAPAIYTLAHSAGRILSGLEGVPGVAAFYGGPQASGPCTGTGEVTWLRWTGGNSWSYLASMCWPNHYLTLTYP